MRKIIREDLSKFFPRRTQPRMSRPMCLRCYGRNSELCSSCHGTGIDPNDRTYEQTVRGDDLTNGFHYAATNGSKND